MRISDWSSYVCSSDLAAEPPKPAATVGVGFAVQIGAFSNTAQAIAKREELRAAGFSAFTETVQTDKGTLTRVLAGPVVSRPEADQPHDRLRARPGISNGLGRPHPCPHLPRAAPPPFPPPHHAHTPT